MLGPPEKELKGGQHQANCKPGQEKAFSVTSKEFKVNILYHQTSAFLVFCF